jgi:hypothetical protein
MSLLARHFSDGLFYLSAQNFSLPSKKDNWPLFFKVGQERLLKMCQGKVEGFLSFQAAIIKRIFMKERCDWQTEVA